MHQFSSWKILRHLDRIVEWQRTGLSRPITYELDMTNACNSKCPFCFGFYSPSDISSLGWDEAKDIIDQIKAFGGKGLTFTGGGEPLCNPATIRAVKYARRKGLDVGFITNGILLNKENAAVLADTCTWVRVSLDAGSKKTYLLTHGLDGDTFETVVRNTRTLVEAKRKQRSGVTIGTGFLTFGRAAGDMRAFTRVSRGIGVDYAQFRPLLKRFRYKEFNGAPEPGILERLNDCRTLATGDFKVLCSIHKYESMKKGAVSRGYGRCYGHNFAAVISANAKMYLCCHMRGIEKYCIGDLKRSTLEKIWGSRRRKAVSANIDFSDCPLLCRCDGFNTLLWNMTREGEHDNFL